MTVNSVSELQTGRPGEYSPMPGLTVARRAGRARIRRIRPQEETMDQSARRPPEEVTDRNLALELVRVTEAAALAASRWIGRGQKNEADGAAVEAMRKAFDQVAIDGTVVIGEGEMDEAPMLYIGEKVGCGGPAMDIAVDPLEGTTLTAKG